MDDRDKLLVDNLKESLRLVQSNMVLGFSFAASALSLVLVNPEKIQVARDLVPLEVPARSAIAILVGLHWVFGMLAGYSMGRVQRIVDLLRGRDRDAAEAVLEKMDPAQKMEILGATDIAETREASAVSASREQEQIVQAVLTYPAIPTIRLPVPRLFLCVASPLLAVASVVGLFGSALVGVFPALGVFVLLAPYLVLAWELRSPVGGRFTTNDYSD